MFSAISLIIFNFQKRNLTLVNRLYEFGKLYIELCMLLYNNEMQMNKFVPMRIIDYIIDGFGFTNCLIKEFCLSFILINFFLYSMF